ncbi:arginine N-succinyltransferase [Natronospirillum operosum]|uniref:Arginine N-succinyltransferase n=1 Tax=Natronospirillum operosum TaxID=2759953 RepID=A0A4Z0W6Z3_9GAMM|nr:arginine N-succinyltransferase [Natronospirillum operosum]TGG92322.1 arginine N-succinyltransferase [Natronospirillum operosum]
MAIIRPIAAQDLDTLVDMARESGVGVTSLPDNPELMERKLNRAVASFQQKLSPEEAHYLFVLQETPDGPPVGLCGIEARIGRDEVWYNYRMGEVIQASKALGLYRRTLTLFLSNDLTGATELGSLYLREPNRRHRNGSVLSKVRYLFLAAFPELFSERVIAEMRGYSDADGHSPFWEGLGRQFFNMEFSDADFLTGSGDKVFIAELMPKFPIYVPMLPPEAQATIGQVHPHTQPALSMLEAEGFRKNGFVDIFDAGPAVQAELHRIGGVRRSERLHAHIVERRASLEAPRPEWLLGNERFSGFRAISVARVHRDGPRIELTPEEADALQISAGDPVRVMNLKPQEPHDG